MKSPCSQHFSDSLHDLDSGLHATKEIPADWKESKECSATVQPVPTVED